MKLAALQLRKFFTYDDPEGKEEALTFPSGTTVLIGPNGSGKTAAGLEAVCWLLWGKTTRGTVPDGDIFGKFTVGPSRAPYEVERTRKAKKSTIRLVGIANGGEKDLSGQTATETQGKIDEVFGSWERFTAERVFSNRLRARFGSATDKERKALVEAILGLERHERAAQVARDELGARKNRLQNVRVEVAGALARVDEAKRALGAATAAGAGPDLGALKAKLASAAARRATAEGQVKTARAAVEDATKRLGVIQRGIVGMEADARGVATAKMHIETRIATLRAKAASSLEMGDCPVCMTPAKDIPRDRMKAHFTAELAPLMKERDLLGARLKNTAELDEARADAKAADEARAKAAAAVRPWEESYVAADTEARGLEREIAAGAQIAARAADAREAATKAEEALAKLRGGEEAAEIECLVAETAAKVLGPRGARVRRMNGALARLTTSANEILARMPVDGTGPLRVKVRGSRELASGKEVDEVSVSVEGAGGGEYDGTSDGERVRLDIAIMLGLARLSGEGEGLIVFDELFDPLDDAGLEAVVEILEEMAATRQVIVTTHNPRFLGLLPASACWRVSRAAGGASTIERQG